MQKRNPLDEVILRVGKQLEGMGAKPGEPVPVPFGYERASARDRARRVYGMSPQERQREMERVGLGEMLKLARTHQKAQRGFRPPGR